jgi:hypothetical protein
MVQSLDTWVQKKSQIYFFMLIILITQTTWKTFIGGFFSIYFDVIKILYLKYEHLKD